jgi:hypothetical protein
MTRLRSAMMTDASARRVAAEVVGQSPSKLRTSKKSDMLGF